jgi:UDP-glucose 4-epimerase
MNKLKVGVLGSSGFIGKVLTKKLETNPIVSELHLFSRSILTGNKTNNNTHRHRFVLSIENQIIPKALYEVEILYYLISESIPANSWDNPTKELSNNLIPFISLIEKIKDGKLKKIIFTSSAGTIYGPTVEKISEDGIKRPFSPHGITKLTTEYFLEYFKIKYKINYSIFRVSNIYGPGQNTNKGLGLVNTILEKFCKNEEIIIYGDGSITRNYIYIHDVVKVLNQEIAFENNIEKIINLASSCHLTINEIICSIETITNQKLKIKNLIQRKSDNPVILIDNSKLIKSFPGFNDTPLKIGISETLKFIKNERKKI